MAINQRNRGLVSVIIPTYNFAKYIVKAIESVLSQTYNNWELIIVDDGSSDDTKEVVASYLSDKRISYHYQENAGQAKAKNTAINLATGEYLAVLDADNICTDDRLEVAVAFLNENPSYGMCHADIISINEQGNIISEHNMARYSELAVNELLKDNFIAINTAVMRLDLVHEIGGFDDTIRRADDYEFCLRFCLSFKIKYLSKKLCFYRVMENQISSDSRGRYESNEAILLNFYSQNARKHPQINWRRGLSFFYQRKARYLKSINRLGGALKAVATSFIWHPFWQGPYRTFLKILLPN